MATLFNQYIPQHAGTPPGAGSSPSSGHAHAAGSSSHRPENERAHHQFDGNSASGQQGPFAGLSSLFSKLLGGKGEPGEKKDAGGLSGILQKLKMEDWDAGDLLLLGILLLLLLEGENTELVIALGLVLFLSL